MTDREPSASLGVATNPGEGSRGSDAGPVRPRPIIDLSRPDRQPTQVMDLSRTLQLHTVRLEISEATLAELRGAKAEPPPVVTPPPTAVPSLQSGDTLRIELPHTRTLAFEAPRDLFEPPRAVALGDTLYDGGALRDLAVQLATVRESESAAPSPVECAITPARSINDALRRPLAAFRRSSWAKQLTIALLPLAAAGVWTMRDGSASASSAHAVASVPPPGPSASLAVPSPAPPPSTSRAPTATSTADTLAEHPLLEGAARPSDPGERLALIAAFIGNKAEAAALYDRLATTRHSRTFALAARLIREERVRKP